MFDGLYLYEWVLMVLGVVLFVVLVIAFFYQLTRKRKIGALLAFFFVPIAMIGYPSIQSMQIKDGVVSLQKTTDALREDPTNPQARQAVEQQVNKLGNRPFSNPAILTSLASAQFALGKEQPAKSNLDKALKADPQLPQATALQNKITTLEKVEQITATVKSNPADETAKAELTKTVRAATEQPVANPKALSTIAQALEVLGDHDKAAKTAEIARKISANPAAQK